MPPIEAEGRLNERRLLTPAILDAPHKPNIVVEVGAAELAAVLVPHPLRAFILKCLPAGFSRQLSARRAG